MSDLTKKMNQVLRDIETKLNNKQDITFVKEKFSDMFIIFLNEIDKLTDSFEMRLESIAINQNAIVEKMAKIENSVDEVMKDIYDEDLYDFEIDCPYCNNQFITEIGKQSNEVKCPECNNIIELDWNGNLDDEQDGCAGGHCGHGCGCHNEEEIDEEDDM